MLIIAAHGSKRQESAREISSLAGKLSVKLKQDFDRVEAAFLQFSDPLLEKKIDEFAHIGADRIIIFPFFISKGTHISSDIPDIVRKAGLKYPEIEFSITSHLGSIDGLDELIYREVTRCLIR